MSTISAGTTSTTTLVATGDTTGSLVFKTNDTGSGGTTAVTIDTSQNVGIGTSSPAQKLDVKGVLQLTNSATPANTSYLYDGGGLLLSSNNSNPMYFYTGASERMRIDSSGNLLVGKTTTAISTAGVTITNYGSVQFTTATGDYSIFNKVTSTTGKQMEFRSVNSSVGDITCSSTTTTYNTSSDYRLKENVQPMTGALATVAQLNPVTYTWKADGSDGQGFIAHELAEVVPDCVTGEKDAVETYTDEDGNEQTRPVYQGIDTSFLVATLTAAIQELKALNDAQASTITQLTERISALENK